MKFQILPQTKQLQNQYQNQSNNLKSYNGEERIYKTVEDRHLSLYREIHSELFSVEERGFFKCCCKHLVLEHDIFGKCKRPNCPCITFHGPAKLPISRIKIIDWKAIEEKMREFRFRRNI